ncbi:unnamed protein product [Mucor hiemalis]
MDKSNDWNSSFWIDELAKLAEDSKYAITLNKTNEPDELITTNQAKNSKCALEKNNLSDKHTFGKLIEVDGYHSDVDTVSEVTSSSSDKEIVKDFDFSYPIKRVAKEQIASDAGNYNTEKSSVKAMKTLFYNTEVLHCTLSDLISGETSPVIKAAVLKMEEDGKVFQKKETNLSFSSFSSFLEKTNGKKLSVNAKSFVPFS